MRKAGAVFLAVFVLAGLAAGMAAANPYPKDTTVYFNETDWSGTYNDTISVNLSSLVGASIGPVQKFIKWDDLAVASVAILGTKIIYPSLKEQQGGDFTYLVAIGVTDYNREISDRISMSGVSGYENYTINVQNHRYMSGRSDTITITKTFVEEASSASEAIQKVKASIGVEFPLFDELVGLKAGGDYTIEHAEAIQYGELYAVTVQFHFYTYYVALEYNGSISYYMQETSRLGVCPTAPPTPPVYKLGTSGHGIKNFAVYPHPVVCTYQSSKEFNFGTYYTFAGPEKVYGLGDFVLPVKIVKSS